MESYIIRVYRGANRHFREFAGIVEEVGSSEKIAFSHFEELVEIFRSIKERPIRRRLTERLKERGSDRERRKEGRIAKELPCVLTCAGQEIEAKTVNCSRHGVGLRIPGTIEMPIGGVLKMSTGEHAVEAQVKWVDSRTVADVTLAGLEIIGGELDIGGMRERQAPRIL